MLACVRELSAEDGKVYCCSLRNEERSGWCIAGAVVGEQDWVSVDRVDPTVFFVFPTGLALLMTQVPLVWLAVVDGPPFMEYLLGTAEEAIRYTEGMNRTRAGWVIESLKAVPVEHLSGSQVVSEDGVLYPSRPFPTWARMGQAPRHEDWPGVPESTKVWPYVPSGFTVDFMFSR